MRKYMLCTALVLSAGCADEQAAVPTATDAESSTTSAVNTVALVKFSCPDMH